ncbi:MAG TPA: PA2169 family four-helix-bundle protein [Pricia sp.]|nr:PA2169 family four-helix-bundle protein [Pricia sp.]
MKTYPEKIAKKLNTLIGKNRDAEKGFAMAADNAKAKSLAFWFNDRSVERKMFNEDLKVEVASFGQDFDESGSLTGDLHRAWMHMKAWTQADSDQAMVKEAISGEKAALREYNEVLDEMGLPSSTKMVLIDQLAKIEKGLEVLQALDEIEYQEE